MLESSFHDPLSAQINAKTRSHHTILNRLITERLPLCLPPHTSGPELYAAGISQFSEIFCAFEEVWDEIIGADGNIKGLEETWQALDEQYPNGSAADLLSFLRTLRPHRLARTERLRADFAYFQGLKGTRAVLHGLDKSKAVEDFVMHIHSELHRNPHLLVAYAWTLYMAIFSGGRWIRAQLRNAGEGFWTESAFTTSAKQDGKDTTLEKLTGFENLGLALWSFEGEKDGEDLKAEFKRRLNDGEHILTPAQRDDIILESQDIFDRFRAIVEDLDAATSKVVVSVQAHQSKTTKSTATANVKVSEKNATAYLFDMPSYTGLALVVSCVSWYAMYHAGTWN